MFIERKSWSKYTPAEIEIMKNTVADAQDGTPFTTEYAAAYLGKSSATLQAMRCNQSDAITYSKIGGHVKYRKMHLDDYLKRCEKLCTA